jgi:hypothetical protein
LRHDHNNQPVRTTGLGFNLGNIPFAEGSGVL